MTPTDILLPVVALLAFLGYVWLLSVRFWIAIILTLTVAYVMWALSPGAPGQTIYWIVGTGIFATALFTMSLIPAPKTTVIEVRQRKNPAAELEYEIIVDGTDVLNWGGHPSLNTLRAVVDHLKDKGIMPYVFLDASSQYLMRDALIDEGGFAKALGLKKGRVMLCPEHMESDGFILGFAKDQALPVVSNDRFELRSKRASGLTIVRGLLADGQPVLDGI